MVKHTGSSASVNFALAASEGLCHGKIGTRNATGELCASRSKSGTNMKSMVELSPTAFRLLLVLKWRTLLPISLASGTAMVEEAGMRGADDLPAIGLSDVRSEENVVAPVMESARVC